MDAYTHQAPTTSNQRTLVSKKDKSPSTVLDMEFNEFDLPSSPARKGSSALSPADFALRSTNPFESESHPRNVSKRTVQLTSPPRLIFSSVDSNFVAASAPLHQGLGGEAFTLSRLSLISSLSSTTTASSESSPTSELLHLSTYHPDNDCEVHEAHLDLRQLSFVAPLGKGSTASVFEVEHSSSELNDSSRHLALKVMKLGKHNDKHWLRERTVLELLKNEPSVVKLVAAFEMAYIPLPPEGVFFDAKTPVRALALEHCPRGELFDIVAQFEYGLPEPVARIYARQIWRAVCGCHRLGVTHRDIKPENIVVAADWSLRLADFGTSLVGETTTLEFCGTETYIAPEVHANMPYHPGPADVWSAGVTCFILLYGVPPFFASNTEDWYFRCAKEGAWDLFWKQHEKSRCSLNIAPLDAAAKRFLQRALDPSPRWRPSAAAMLDDPWLFDASPGGAGPGDAELESLMTDLGVKSPPGIKSCRNHGE